MWRGRGGDAGSSRTPDIDSARMWRYLRGNFQYIVWYVRAKARGLCFRLLAAASYAHARGLVLQRDAVSGHFIHRRRARAVAGHFPGFSALILYTHTRRLRAELSCYSTFSFPV